MQRQRKWAKASPVKIHPGSFGEKAGKTKQHLKTFWSEGASLKIMSLASQGLTHRFIHRY